MKSNKLYGSLFLFFFLIGSFWVYEQTQVNEVTDGEQWQAYNEYHAKSEQDQIATAIANRNKPRTFHKYAKPEDK